MKKGTKVLIRATIIRQADDQRPDQEKGWVVETSRGEVYVNPCEIISTLKEFLKHLEKYGRESKP